MKRIRAQLLWRSWFILAAAATIMALTFAPVSCRQGGGQVESITLGMVADITNALTYIADEQKLFTANGLEVTLKDYDTGSAASDAMIKGQVDLVTATEFVVVEKAFQKERISIIASRDKFQSIFLGARKDRGIENIADLKGKKIGLPRQSINEFYLSRFLDRQGMSIKDVTLVDVKPSQSVDAFNTGVVEAVVIRKSFIDEMARQHSDGMVVWAVQSDQLAYGVLASRNDWIREHPELVKRLLISLAQAEDFLLRQPAEAKAIVQRQLNYDDSSLESVWAEHQFALSLDLPLIAAMTDEARWMIENNLTTGKQIPDFLDYVYEDGLKAVRPGAVNVLR